ncbi:MAG: FAD-dependent oxidoreductase [Desulfuromonadaceae bacterium]
MKKVRYLILGAGPAGLSFAHALLDAGEDSFLVLEQEDIAGGLCRSEQVDDSPLDIGGGHFLETRPGRVLDFIFRFVPRDEWNLFRRDSRILLWDKEIGYPLETNLWQLPLEVQIDFLESIAAAGVVSKKPMPEQFDEWVRWKLGDRIADEYMLPYNRKIWPIALNRLGTYWLHKLPDISFRDTLKSCLERSQCGSVPAHGTFYYPKKNGIGELWRRMGNALGNRLRTKTAVHAIDVENRVINGEFQGDVVINTIPWTTWQKTASLPERIGDLVGLLEYSSIDVEYHPETIQTEAQWLYVPDESLPYHRILCRNLFVSGSRGHWTETNSKRSAAPEGWRHRNHFAYPLNTVKKPAAISEILAWAESKRILGLGRWGQWEHINMDVTVNQALTIADEVLFERAAT